MRTAGSGMTTSPSPRRSDHNQLTPTYQPPRPAALPPRPAPRMPMQVGTATKPPTIQHFIMICKLSLEGVSKVARLTHTVSLTDLRALVHKFYPRLEGAYELYYLDEDNDQITICVEEDFELFKERAGDCFKIYIQPREADSSSQPSHRNNPSITDSFQDPQEQPQERERPPSEKKQAGRREEEHHVSCSGCKSHSIVGVRYQCPFCIGFNLCEACERGEDHPHALLKVKNPRKELNYSELLNHLTLEFPSEILIAREKELQDLRESYNSLLKLLQKEGEEPKLRQPIQPRQRQSVEPRRQPIAESDRLRRENERMEREFRDTEVERRIRGDAYSDPYYRSPYDKTHAYRQDLLNSRFRSSYYPGLSRPYGGF